MSRSLEDVLNGNAPKDREKIKQLIDRVLEKKRTEIGNGDGFDCADINAAAQKGAGYKVETLGEALMYIADEEAYSGIREQLDEISNKRFDVCKHHPDEYYSYPGDWGFNWGSDRIKDMIMGKLELCNKTKPFFQPIEISDYWRDWAREFCKYYSRMLLEKASSDRDLRIFMTLKYGDFLYALNAEDWFDEVQGIIPFDRIDDALKARSIGDILQNNLDNSRQSWNMMYGYYDFKKQIQDAIDNIRALIMAPLMFYYDNKKT